MSAEDDRLWLHEMRNAVNALCVTSVVLTRVLAIGNVERARELASELESSCERCRELMGSPPDDLQPREPGALQ
jgi:hypothetical protein